MAANSPLEFHFASLTQDIICGPDAISGMADTLDRLGVRRAMVVCGPSILEGSDVVQRVQHALGDRCAGLFSGVAPHSPVEVLREAVAAAKDLQPDGLAHSVGTEQFSCQAAAVFSEINQHQVIGVVQLLVNEGH